MYVAVVTVFGLVLCNDLYSKSETASIVTILAIGLLLSEEQQEMASQ